MKKILLFTFLFLSYTSSAQNRIGEHVFETLESEGMPIVYKKDSIYSQLQFVEYVGEKEFRRLYIYQKDTCIAYILRMPPSEKNFFIQQLNKGYTRNQDGWADWPNKTVIWLREDQRYLTLEFYHVEKGKDIKAALRLFSKAPTKKI